MNDTWYGSVSFNEETKALQMSGKATDIGTQTGIMEMYKPHMRLVSTPTNWCLI